MGGIVGLNYNNSIIENSYNAGNIVCEDAVNMIGGIVGRNYGGENQIKNCYNVGKLQYKSASNPGGIVGFNYSPGVISNSYYLDTIATKVTNGNTTNVTNCASKTSEEMRNTSENTSFVTLLETDNAEADKPVWLPDTTNMNGGYPILAWQREN